MDRSRIMLLVVTLAMAALAGPDAVAAQERPYEEGSVWQISFVRTAPGHYDDYLAELSRVWRRFNEEALAQGHINSFKVLSSPRPTEDGWDLMLMVEYPNMAALDDTAERFDPIAQSIIGSLQEQGAATVERATLRTIVGDRLARELIFR